MGLFQKGVLEIQLLRRGKKGNAELGFNFYIYIITYRYQFIIGSKTVHGYSVIINKYFIN